MARSGLLLQTFISAIIGAYMHGYHRIEVERFPKTPLCPPFLALTSHFSVLDVPALIVADFYRPRSTLVVKESVMRVPLVREVIRAWAAVPVARDGKDLSALRDIIRTVKGGRGICVAAQGTRSRSGRLGPMHPVLMRLAVRVAAEGIPVFPVVENGTYESMPPGVRFPRPTKIRVRLGEPIELSRWLGKRLDGAELAEVAGLVQTKIADLLPPERRPLPDTIALNHDPIFG